MFCLILLMAPLAGAHPSQLFAQEEKATLGIQRRQKEGEQAERKKPIPESLLEEVYDMITARPPEERGFLILELAAAYRRINSRRAASLDEELFQTSYQIPLDWHNYRYAFQFNAVRGLADMDLSKAQELFAQMEAPPKASKSVPNQDLRAVAALFLFPKLLEGMDEIKLEWISAQARHLGDTGQYPYIAVQAILPQVAQAQPLAAEGLFEDALRYFKKDRGFATTPTQFLELVETAQEWVRPDQITRAVESLVDRLLDPRKRDDLSSLIRVRLGNGQTLTFNALEDRMLFDLLPRIRDLNPSLAKRVLELRPQFAVALEIGGRIEAEESVTVEGHLEDSERLRFIQREALAWQAVDEVATLAEKDVLEATRKAKEIEILAAQLAAEARVAAALAKTNPTAARATLLRVIELLDRVDSPNDRLQLDLAVLRAEEALGEASAVMKRFSEMLPLAEELIEQQVLLGPGVPVSLAPAYAHIQAATPIAAKVDAQNTLQSIGFLSSVPLQAHLKILVAESLFERGLAQAAR